MALPGVMENLVKSSLAQSSGEPILIMMQIAYLYHNELMLIFTFKFKGRVSILPFSNNHDYL
jgi:hypothetical protein